MKKIKALGELSLIKQSRLSVMPIDTKCWKIILKMGKLSNKKNAKKKKKNQKKKLKLKLKKVRKSFKKKNKRVRLKNNRKIRGPKELIYKVKQIGLKKAIVNKSEYEKKYKQSLKDNDRFWKKEGKENYLDKPYTKKLKMLNTVSLMSI